MVKSIVAAVLKRGRKSKKGRPSNKVKELMESKDISRAEAEKLVKKESSSKKKSVKKKTAKKKTDKKKDEPKRSKSEQGELNRLVKQQKRDMSESSGIETPRAGSTSEERLSINAPARSKELPPVREDMSSAQLRRMVTSGLAGIGNKGQVTNKGTYSSGADVGQRMMRGGDGNVNTKALEDELRELGGFEGLFKGGKVGKGKGKGIGKGCGKAMRGAGAVRKD
tara:strand:- start:46 stop:717 length:672 start_codon:yes stop_codon:yes gene_type:complete